MAGAAPAVGLVGDRDDSAVNDVSLNEAPVTIKTADVKRTGEAQLAGHGKLNAQTGVGTCDACNRPISGAMVTFLTFESIVL